MTQSTNPLDRIRSLTPADMTDDELGVAVNYEAGLSISYSPGKTHSPNPALSYDALLPIVRKWVGSNRPRCNQLLQRLCALLAGSNDDALEDWPFATNIDGLEHGFMALLSATPRQLAEAFVTAAREVG